MRAVAGLVNEHRMIQRVCNALAAFGEEARGEGFDGRVRLEQFVLFVREFADRLHHRKEEDFLFAAMVRAGLAQGTGAVARMLLEHDAVRRYVAALDELAELPHAWNVRDRVTATSSVRAYVELLSDHIDVEESLVFPLAEQSLPEETRAAVDAACAEFEATETASIARMTVLGEKLASQHVGSITSA